MGHFFDESLNFLVNMLLEAFEDSVHSVLVLFEVVADVFVYKVVRELHSVKCHAASDHEDGFFSTERLIISLFLDSFDFLELRHREFASGVFLDGADGLHGGLESFPGLVLLFHEAHDVVTSSDLNPHRVVPDLASKIEDFRNSVRHFLGLVAVVLLGFVMFLSLFSSFLGLVMVLLSFVGMLFLVAFRFL